MKPTAQKPELSDEALFRGFRAGDSGAFDDLMRRHHGAVFAIAYARLGNADSAEDLAQEVFLRAYLQHGQLRDGSRFAPWVCHMARNLAIDWKRRGETRSRLLPLVPFEEEEMKQIPQTGSPDPAEAAAQAEHRALADAAMAELPPEQRELVMLHFAEGLGKSEIARRLGVHPSTVGRQLDGAVAAMRTEVEKSLKRSAPALRPTRLATARATAMVAALAAMTPEAKAAIIGTAAEHSVAMAAADAAGKLTLLELLKMKLGLVATGIGTMGTTKMIIGGGALCAALLGGSYIALHEDGPGANAANAAAVAAGATIAGVMDYYPGTEVELRMEYGKLYQINFKAPAGSEDEGAVSLVSIGRDGTLRSETTAHTGRVEIWEEKLDTTKVHILTMMDDTTRMLGSTQVRFEENEGVLGYWLNNSDRHVADIKPVYKDYFEGRINQKTFRDRFVGVLRKNNVGPRNQAHREAWYSELERMTGAPMSMPEEFQ